MAEVLVIAGTSDARRLIDELIKKNIKIVATVATGYGNQILGTHPCLQVHTGRLNSEEIAGLIAEHNVRCLVDASHPFAKEVSMNSIDACAAAGIPYLRYERAETQTSEESGIFMAGDYIQAAQHAAEMTGNILLTIGSNNLAVFTRHIPDYKQRLFARVLPDSTVIARCEAAGLSASNIIAIKGPFSEEMNIEMIKLCKARCLVTKDSGKEGGVTEKITAARKAGAEVVLIKKPVMGYKNCVGSIDEVIRYVGDFAGTGGTVV